MKKETRRRIEEALANWDDPNSEARILYENFQEEMDRQFQSLIDAITDSERLTNEDLSIRVRARWIG